MSSSPATPRRLTRAETIDMLIAALDSRLWKTADGDLQLRLFSRYEAETIRDALSSARSETAPRSAVAAPETERDHLRRVQAWLVMPMIGTLLDAWESVPNDMKSDLREIAPQLGEIIGEINDAIEHPEQAPAEVKALQSATRETIIEECALVLDRIVAAMAAHKNPEGIVTGEDFHEPEITYIREAAKDIRKLKGSAADRRTDA